MISEIQFSSVKKSKVFGYAAELPFFKKNKKLELKPGLNVLFGPNGCGKSTILRMAALTLAAEQGGISTVTQSWIESVTTQHLFEKGCTSAIEPVKVLHDGQPLLYGNPRNAIGVRGGHLDDDFYLRGMLNLTSRASTGMATMQRINGMLAVSQKDARFPTEVDIRFERHGVNDLWKARYDRAIRLLEASIPRGQSTLIFDEPESGLGIPVQGHLFNRLYQAAVENDFQIVVATHSAFCLGLPGANYIDMEEGYLAHAEECMEIVGSRIKERGPVPAAHKAKRTTKPKPADNDEAPASSKGRRKNAVA